MIGHHALQLLIAGIGEKLGYQTKIEYKTRNGRIDVIWKSDSEFITFEIDLGKDKTQILGNFLKCKMLRPNRHIHIVRNSELEKWLENLNLGCDVVSLETPYKQSQTKIDESVLKHLPLQSMRATKIKEIFTSKYGISRRTAERWINYLKQRRLLKQLDGRERNPLLIKT